MWHTGSEHSDEGFKKEAVAVKCLDDSNNEEAKVKFLQEAAIMAQFNHPNIIRILGIVMDDQVCLYFSVNVAICIIWWTFSNAKYTFTSNICFKKQHHHQFFLSIAA